MSNNQPDDEWFDDGTAVETTCEECDEVKLCRNLPDPVKAELDPDAENPARWLCRRCYVERGYDI